MSPSRKPQVNHSNTLILPFEKPTLLTDIETWFVVIMKKMINGQHEQDLCPHTTRTGAHFARYQGKVDVFGNDGSVLCR